MRAKFSPTTFEVEDADQRGLWIACQQFKKYLASLRRWESVSVDLRLAKERVQHLEARVLALEHETDVLRRALQKSD